VGRDGEVTRVADFTARTLRRPSAPVHGTSTAPAIAAPSAAVLLIGGSGGSEPWHAGEALAREGIAALPVAYFARPGLPDQLRGISLEYFFSALEILQEELSSPGAPLAVPGMSRGKRGGTADGDPLRYSRSRGAGHCSGNVVVAGSWPPGGSAWLLDGRPLPDAEHTGPDCADPDALIPSSWYRGRYFCCPRARTRCGHRPT
jgi:hypothetical protein